MNVHHRLRRTAVLSVFAVSVLSGVAHAQSDISQDLTQRPSEAICQKLSSETVSGVDLEDRAAVVAFYTARGCRPVWTEQGGLTRSATRLIAELKQATDWGLDGKDFQLPHVDAVKVPSNRETPDLIADAEFELSGAVLRYARYARGGRIPDPTSQLTTYIDRKPELPDPAVVLAEITVSPEPDAVLRAYQPQHEQFLRLKALLLSERKKENDAQAISIPPSGPQLRADSRHADVALLKRRLEVASAAGEEELFTPELVAAVKRFQTANGLRADGIVGRASRKAFNAEAPRGVGTIIANMEAWRWMPRELGDKYIFINVPSYNVTLVDHGQKTFDERVIVGETKTQTPIFSMDMRTVVLRPEWYLPDSIKLKKLLSSRSLESQGYVIKKNGRKVESWRIDWSKANLSAYSISQPSGDDNALGLVKFLFPNKHSVYLHDTPSKSLFNSAERLFSHGCIRVRNPLQLAEVLLNADKGAGKMNVKALVRKGPHQNEINLDTPVPVHIGYFTTWVEDDGTVTYLRDPYGHEKRITLALAGAWSKIDKGRDHLAAVDTSQLKAMRRAAAPRPGEPPMGLMTTFQGQKYQYRRWSGNTVGDMIGRALGQW